VLGADGDLDLAAGRLEQWEALNTETPFNDFAVCLSMVLCERQRITHSRLINVLRRLVRKQVLTAREVYATKCGNNMYAMQLVTEFILRRLARGEPLRESEVVLTFDELQKYRSGSGLFYDTPRAESAGVRLFPLAYCSKFLFLIGMCHELLADARFPTAFVAGMRAILPLFAADGTLAFFGRSDNTTFAAGLAFFNLHLAAKLDGEQTPQFAALAEAQIQLCMTFPRTPEGWLCVNRNASCVRFPEGRRSSDTYTYPTEYSVAFTVYVLLALLHCESKVGSEFHRSISSFEYADAGIVCLANGSAELFLRTHSDNEAEDRRYYGPTILRFSSGDTLAIGAIPKTCSTDSAVTGASTNRLVRMLKLLIYRYRVGLESLDRNGTGFVPVVRLGREWLVPENGAVAVQNQASAVSFHSMARVQVRGWRVAFDELRDVILKNLGRMPRSREHGQSTPTSVNLTRRIELRGKRIFLRDTIRGPITGGTLFFSTRQYEAAKITMGAGFHQTSYVRGWSSDGNCDIATFCIQLNRDEVSYQIDIACPDQVEPSAPDENH
jgi:hypothetical protein